MPVMHVGQASQSCFQNTLPRILAQVSLAELQEIIAQIRVHEDLLLRDDVGDGSNMGTPGQ